MQTMRPLFLSLALLAGSALAADSPKPYLTPWVTVGPTDARLQAALAPGGSAKLSVNAPGLLLDVPADAFGDSADAARRLVAFAHRNGRRAGVSVVLPPAAVPKDARAAELATSETLYPGLGSLLLAARGADLFELTFPKLPDDLRDQSFTLKRVAAEIRAANPSAKVAVRFALNEASSARFLTEELAAYVDLLGAEADDRTEPLALREAADKVAFGRPLLVHGPALADPDALLAFAARFAAFDAPVVTAPLSSPADKDATLDRLGQLLAGDFSRDGRAATVTAGDRSLPVTRIVSGLDLGGLVLIPATERGPITLTLDAPSYLAAEVVELATGRTKKFDIPKTTAPTRLTLSTASGSLVVKLTAREKAPAEATKADVGVAAVRGLTAEEILARHQVWRADRDARWHRFVARNKTSIRFRFADLNTTLDLTLSGQFFFEPGKGYDWAWSEAFYNGVKWRGKKIPELPLLQPEKVSELPLALTFNDAYRYTLTGEAVVNGTACYVLDFEPKATASDKPIYAGTVHVSKSDFSAVRTKTRQLNLVGEVQSVDEQSDFTEVTAPDGGAPLRFPTRTTGQWILRTFSRTTVMERETTLEELRLDPAGYEEEKAAAYRSNDVMVRDTERGVRYLEKTKDGGRVVVEDAKTSRLFGLAGVFYDDSLDYPLPLLGIYYLDLDFRKKREQVQVFFGGILLAASFNEPSVFGTKLDLGADVFGIAIRGTDALFVNGEEDKTQRVKQRSFAGNLNIGYPVGRHMKVSATLGTTHRDFATDDAETAPGFTAPSNHWVTRLQSTAIWDLQGYAVTARFAWNKRSTWDAWGTAGNPDYEPGKDQFRTYSVQVAKDFHFPKFQRLRSSISYLGSNNTDRFSKYSFGFFGGSSLRGFRSGSLRAEQAFIGRAAYGVAIGSALRIEGIYEHAVLKDPAAGLDWANFGGAGLSGQLPGPWTTIMQIDAGLPVVGRARGQKGFVVNLVFLKIF